MDPDIHVNSMQGREIDRKTWKRADRITVRVFAKSSHWGPPVAGNSPGGRNSLLGAVIAGGFDRRAGTVFGGTGGSAGLGVHFAAVANLVYRRAMEAKLGFEVDGKWFRQSFTP